MTLALASAAVLWLAFPPVGLWPMAPAGVALLLESLRRSPSFGRAAAGAFAARAAAIAVLSFTYLHKLSPAVWGLYALNWGAVWAVYGILFHLLRKKGGDAVALGCAPFLWTLFDRFAPWATFFPSDIPTLATAFGGSPLLAAAPALGIYGLSFVSAAAGAAVLLLLDARRTRERVPLAVAGGLAACGVLPVLFWALAAPSGALSARTLRAACVHLRADRSEEAWWPWETRVLGRERRDAFLAFAAARLDEALPGLRGKDVGLILLPEDAIDVMLETDRSGEAFRRWGLENNGALLDAYRSFARRAGLPVSVGLTVRRHGARRNAVLLVGPDGDILSISDKFHLTPGSETWPMAWLGYWKLLRRGAGSPFVDPRDVYLPGAEPHRLLSGRGGSFGAPMCLEGHVPGLARGWRRNGAEFLTLVSNAVWFDADPAAYNAQLLSLVRLQAAAYGIPVVLTGKKGLMGSVDARGKAEVRSLAPDAPTEVLVAEVELDPGLRTLAGRWGEYFVPLSAAALLLLGLMTRIRKTDRAEWRDTEGKA